jgi:hypothetical protein
MPRTAFTVAETHAGEEKLIYGRKVAMPEQLAKFRALRGQPSHEEFSLLSYQESDGLLLQIKFRSPAEQKEWEAKRAAEVKAHQEATAQQAAKTAGASKVELKEKPEEKPPVKPKK